MGKDLLYKDLAKYYDVIYYWKDYSKEAGLLVKLISKYKKSEGKELLEAGCGTGHHLQFLKDNFKCTGTDINQEMLNVAKKKNKDVTFRKADMIDMKLNKKFDVIISMFSSIGYVKTITNLKKTLQNFSGHLKSGGVLIIEPWFSQDQFTNSKTQLISYEDDKIKIARMSKSKRKGNISILDMDYLVSESGEDTKHFKDRHELGLFETEKTLELMESAGLKSRMLKNGFMKGRGVFIGVKE
ncbi:MAG: class I SAM-dependent methyltransferase [Candidatus Aenigmarchaeota archaeon]|nr:class I SAM-dependent methyltransferase [Candidatus Aenigmarchaeota archaeon]